MRDGMFYTRLSWTRMSILMCCPCLPPSSPSPHPHPAPGGACQGMGKHRTNSIGCLPGWPTEVTGPRLCSPCVCVSTHNALSGGFSEAGGWRNCKETSRGVGRTTRADHPVEGVAGVWNFQSCVRFFSVAHKQQASERGKDLRTEGVDTPRRLCGVKPSCWEQMLGPTHPFPHPVPLRLPTHLPTNVTTCL